MTFTLVVTVAVVAASADTLRAEISAAVAPLDAVVSFESNDPRIASFARTAAGDTGDLAAAEAVFGAILELIRTGRILRDSDNRPKARSPHTGVEVLLAALDLGSEPLAAGCYELTAAFLAATHALGIPTFGMDAIASEGQIGHIVAGLDGGSGRKMVFDLQNGWYRRAAGYRRLTPREMAAHHYNHLAVSHHLNGAYALARVAVDAAIRLGGAVPSFLNNRAAALSALGKPWSARAEIAHAIAAEPGNTTFRYQWGMIAWELGRPEEAARAFVSVIVLDPGHALALAAAERAAPRVSDRLLRASLGRLLGTHQGHSRIDRLREMLERPSP